VGPERGPLRLVAAPVQKTENTAVRISCADHATPSILSKLTLTSPTSGGRSVGIFRSRTKATEFVVLSIPWTFFLQDPCTPLRLSLSYLLLIFVSFFSLSPSINHFQHFPSTQCLLSIWYPIAVHELFMSCGNPGNHCSVAASLLSSPTKWLIKHPSCRNVFSCRCHIRYRVLYCVVKEQFPNYFLH
jgi:hypothetical protein